ncbi:MAG: hypothetical protein EPN93_11505 [Spirochaetes bacterium]|nr:MAG: hypothetical protein EPN93_11505 [Spirochaetota bacterium]
MSKSIPLPSDITDPIILADWLELIALTAADGNSSHGDLQRVLNRLGVENLDTLCNDTMRELNRRVTSSKDSYPFSFSGTLLKVRNNWKCFSPYIFCLLLSYCDNSKKSVKGFRHEVMFEQLSCIAAKHYIGGDSLRFGFPRDTLPSGFLQALKHVCGQVGEWTVSRRTNTLRTKDGGLDVIAWKSFPDQLIGKLILFGHCASGENWNEKINELQPNDFCSQWLDGDKSPIVKSFFIPHRVSPEIFEHRAISAKLFFDRCRIAYWATADEFNHTTIGNNLKWCEKMLKRIRS